MVLPGHLSGGYLATGAVLSLFSLPLSSAEINALYIIGTIAGEIPDIDLFAFYFEKKKDSHSSNDTHREYLTHTPFFWLIFSSIISLFGLIFSSSFVMILGLIVFVGTISHFILDSIDYGIVWFSPFYKKRFAIFEMKPIEVKSENEVIGSLSYYWNYLQSAYLKQVTFYAEVLITIIAIFVLLN